MAMMTENGGIAREGRPPRPSIGIGGTTSAEVPPQARPPAPSAMARPMMFKKGGKVKKTGWAIVHKGETVMAEEKKGGKKKAAGKKKGGSKKKVHTMHIRKAANEGYIATHDFEKPQGGGGDMGDMATPPSEDHVLPNIQALQDHVGDHMGPQEEEPEPQPQQGQAGPGAAMGGM